MTLLYGSSFIILNWWWYLRKHPEHTQHTRIYSFWTKNLQSRSGQSVSAEIFHVAMFWSYSAVIKVLLEGNTVILYGQDSLKNPANTFWDTSSEASVWPDREVRTNSYRRCPQELNFPQHVPVLLPICFHCTFHTLGDLFLDQNFGTDQDPGSRNTLGGKLVCYTGNTSINNCVCLDKHCKEECLV